MKRTKKYKLIVSKPSQKKNSLLRKVALETKPRRKAVVGLDTRPGIRDFSFEEEAARLAHLYGWDELPRLQDLSEAIESEHESDEEIIANHDDQLGRYEDSHVLEKFHRTHKSEEKEGWEAFYG